MKKIKYGLVIVVGLAMWVFLTAMFPNEGYTGPVETSQPYAALATPTLSGVETQGLPMLDNVVVPHDEDEFRRRLHIPAPLEDWCCPPNYDTTPTALPTPTISAYPIEYPTPTVSGYPAPEQN